MPFSGCFPVGDWLLLAITNLAYQRFKRYFLRGMAGQATSKVFGLFCPIIMCIGVPAGATLVPPANAYDQIRARQKIVASALHASLCLLVLNNARTLISRFTGAGIPDRNVITVSTDGGSLYTHPHPLSMSVSSLAKLADSESWKTETKYSVPANGVSSLMARSSHRIWRGCFRLANDNRSWSASFS